MRWSILNVLNFFFFLVEIIGFETTSRAQGEDQKGRGGDFSINSRPGGFSSHLGEEGSLQEKDAVTALRRRDRFPDLNVGELPGAF